MKLAETQRLFWELLQGTEGPLDAFVGSSALPAEERVAIYARMFLHRQVDALREMFPKVVAALGDEGFFEVAARYVHDHPSEHPDLGQLGRTFAAFHEQVDADEARAVQVAADGAAVGEICGVFGDAARAADVLQGWLAEGWIGAR